MKGKKSRPRSNRYRKLLKSKGRKNAQKSKRGFDQAAPESAPGAFKSIPVRGYFIDETSDGWDRYEVNQLALDPPVESKVMPPKKPRAFERVTIQTATKEQLVNALHKISKPRK
jgi:hypothetical protein